jgi:hypothetical protein
MHANMQLKLPKYALKMSKYALKNSKTSTSNTKIVLVFKIFRKFSQMTFAVVGGVKHICEKAFFPVGI